MKTSHKVLIAIIILIALGFIARYTILKDKFDQWGAGLEKIGAWQTNYKKDHPNATKEEMDAAFNSGMANIGVWKAEYKKNNPGASDADADTAFNAAWKK